ncbi:ImmA/IrrE family metallo-endopeptidase [Streptomyces sp. NPDC058307]|uniref:ImmA/IrrE family metallo-endopeptidase n=1 Tax=Streptomyces sp. NPDC058307 TaxID=3346439 RepID=UPI0036E65BBA
MHHSPACCAGRPQFERLLTTEQEAVSALTVHAGTRRQIWVNDSHDPGRQNSSADHEIAHALLMHPPGPALDVRGCRHWDGEIEEEADWLAGNLLITNEGAWSIARRGLSPEAAMLRYGVSRSMLTWRMNKGGAQRPQGSISQLKVLRRGAGRPVCWEVAGRSPQLSGFLRASDRRAAR